jgi:hypothetical protein
LQRKRDTQRSFGFWSQQVRSLVAFVYSRQLLADAIKVKAVVQARQPYCSEYRIPHNTPAAVAQRVIWLLFTAGAVAGVRDKVTGSIVQVCGQSPTLGTSQRARGA